MIYFYTTLTDNKMENLGKRGKELYRALREVNSEIDVRVLTGDGFKAMYLDLSETCKPVIEIGSNWYQFRGCNGDILSSSNRFRKSKDAKKEAFIVKRVFRNLDPTLTQRIALEIKKSHPLLEALQSVLPGKVEIIDGVPGYSAQGFNVRATSPKTLHISGNHLGEKGHTFDNLSPKNVSSKLGERLF